MRLNRRAFLQSAGLAGAALVVPRVAAAASVPATAPKTGFEQRGGASWTTHEEELAFLTAVARGSQRVSIDVVGRTEPVLHDPADDDFEQWERELEEELVPA